jgi:AcrR family transcriptional regulator
LRTDSRTQDRILDAAESLFAQRGIRATSLRSITNRAGVNAAAIHYHFGSKQSLIHAMHTHRIAPLSQERVARLERLESHYRGEAIPAERLVEAYVEPLVSAKSELGVGMARLEGLLARLRSEDDADSRQLGRHVIDVNERFARALCRGRAIDLEEARDRMNYATGSIVQLLRQTLATPDQEGIADLHDDHLSHLVRFLGAGLAAPPAAASVLPRSARREVAIAAGGRGA